MTNIEIWQPRYKDNTVLIACYKVCEGINYVEFTKAKHLAGFLYEVEGSLVRQCPTQKNGKIDVYVVPMNLLKRIK